MVSIVNLLLRIRPVVRPREARSCSKRPGEVLGLPSPQEPGLDDTLRNGYPMEVWERGVRESMTRFCRNPDEAASFCWERRPYSVMEAHSSDWTDLAWSCLSASASLRGSLLVKQMRAVTVPGCCSTLVLTEQRVACRS